MNDSKTEFIIFGTKHQLKKCTTNCIQLENTNIARSDSVKYLGVHMDKEMNLTKHITEKCWIASFNLYKIRKIRKHFDLKSIRTIIQALVISHLDYGNALLYDLPETTIKQMQSIQNSAAKLILKLGKYDSSTQALKTLHWLPIRKRIEFKILTIVHKALYGTVPDYIKRMIRERTTGYNLRFKKELHVPKPKLKKLTDRSFSVCGPKLWNRLPQHLRVQEEFGTFKRLLKTHLFRQHFNQP